MNAMRRWRMTCVALLLAAVGLAAVSLARAAEPVAIAVETIGLTVADMERSLAFYTGVLGFEPVADVEVAGAPYEALQGVFGLWMRVVRLRLGDEAIELTEYLAPRGRPAPVDLAHWQTRVTVRPGALGRRAVTLPDDGLGFRTGMLVHDPDGHVLLLAEGPR